jgi:ribosomal protein S6
LRHYELVTILSPMLNQDDAAATWEEIKSFITNREAEITAEQTWGTRRLAYPIRKGNYNFLEGSYYLSSFAADNPFNRELENYLRLHENVLRALVTRCDGPMVERPVPGPLTAPSRYVPPGRGRRNDGGGPIPEAPAPAAERGSGAPPPTGQPGVPAAVPTPGSAPAPTAPQTTAPAPEAPAAAAVVAEAAPENTAPAPEAPAAEAVVAEAAPQTTAPAPEAPAVDAVVAEAAPESPAPASEPPAISEPAPDEPASGASAQESEA